MRHIASEANSLADALSRGSPFDELETRREVLLAWERRWGRHTVDRYARAANAVARRFNTPTLDSRGVGACALASDWDGENNYVFAPPSEMPRVAQYLQEHPDVSATVVVPYWPAQPWFQQLTELAAHCEVAPVSAWATPPPQQHSSARHALSGAMLACVRVEGRPAGCSRRGRRAVQ